jgi:lipopolysaccharide/colanic/teichoic acid biosynthesis glycosyltransferase
MRFGLFRHSKHLRWAGSLFLADCLLVWVSFALGIWIRFGTFKAAKLEDYALGVALASVVLPAIFYIGGLYSPRPFRKHWIHDFRWLLTGVAAVVVVVLVTGALDYSSRVGRGVLAASLAALGTLLGLRYGLTRHRRLHSTRALLCVATSEEDERAAEKLFGSWGDQAQSFGLLLAGGYQPRSGLPVAGHIGEPGGGWCPRDPGDVILFRDAHFQVPAIASFLRSVRYGGAEILPLADACEDIYHTVPLELVTDSWLFQASLQSTVLYVRKLKRFSDIGLALGFLILLGPILGLGALIVRFCSPGPLLFRQERAGRFGRPITVLKLRTMHAATSPDQARWATEETHRIFPAGRFLRAFRIDEIPQLLNVLRGDMSFVGPRPEQLPIVEELARHIPFYRERLLIPPGITGWAQVNYPYGSSIEDAARKLEYDLYYMKHMGILLDFFILLETVKTIVRGGLAKGDSEYLEFRGDLCSLENERNRGSEPPAPTSSD